MADNFEQGSKTNPTSGITANTYVSLGLLISIVAATWIISSSVNKATNSIENARQEFIGRMDRMEARLAAVERNKESWTDGDMFRWAVHLQKENPTLKVPEPEQHTSR